jgi:hypothetical protein
VWGDRLFGGYMRLIFDGPVNLNQHFSIPSDLTLWPGFGYLRANGGMTPARDRASFSTLSNAMTATTAYGNSLTSTFGVYIIGFNEPKPAFYVGVAGNDGKAPEGVRTRILKHRVKATGSHIGSAPDKTGGVHHPEQWQFFASSRAQSYSTRPAADQCADARLVIGQIDLNPLQPTKILEYFEHLIYKNENGIRDYLYGLLWPGVDPSSVILLTSGSNRGTPPIDPEIRLWDGSIHGF